MIHISSVWMPLKVPSVLVLLWAGGQENWGHGAVLMLLLPLFLRKCVDKY